MVLVMFPIMKTKSSLILSCLAALLITNFAGCDEPGPITKAVALSSQKTFNVVGRYGKDETQPKIEGPLADVVAQAVRDEAGAKGYLYQPDSASADFLISVSWDHTEKLVASDVPGPPTVKVDLVQLAIVARDRVSNTVLWTGPSAEPIDPGSLTNDGAKGTVKRAMADFPPAQPSR